MGKKIQGNGLFESSRFMLPEHAERMRQYYKEDTILIAYYIKFVSGLYTKYGIFGNSGSLLNS